MKLHYNKRITAERITKLKPNEVFVFGSNLSGIHGAGAAKLAADKFGAILYKGIGHYGNTYAIPTKNEFIQTMSVDTIQKYVRDFIHYADQHPHVIFLVTEIGCGLAGYEPKEIAPLFRGCMYLENVHLPQRFWNILVPQSLPVKDLSDNISIPRPIYDLCTRALQEWKEDLESGINDGIYEEGQETLDEINEALEFLNIK